MQENRQIDIEKKDNYITEIDALKIRYKSLKKKIEWVDDNYEEEMIQEKMKEYATQIKTLKQKLAAIESTEQKA
jgi:hypothetical protein